MDLLKTYNLPWRPDCIPFRPPESFGELRGLDNCMASESRGFREANKIIEKVKTRGVLGVSWNIDFITGSAILKDTIEITFCISRLQHVIILGYRRLDESSSDWESNEYLIEDGVFDIYKKHVELRGN